MHQVLCVPELLDVIFGFIQPHGNAVNARVCKRWSDVALNFFWRDVDDLRLLFALLAPLRRSNGSVEGYSDGGIYEFKRSPEPADWKRFEKYAVRVRRLTPMFYINVKISNLLEDVARTRTYPDILPNIHTLHWHDHKSVQHSLIFLHSRVKHLSISLPTEKNLLSFCSFFSEVITRAPHITSFKVGFATSWPDVEDDLVYFLSNISKLQRIEFSECYLTLKLAETLSRLEHLQAIDCMIGPYGKEISPIFTVGTFPALREYSFSGALNDAANFLSHFSPHLSNLSIYSNVIEASAAMKNFLSVVSENFQFLESLSISSNMKQDEKFGIVFDTLKPMLKLSYLISIRISDPQPLLLTQTDIEAIAPSWPSLKSLWLNCEPYHAEKSTLTLNALNPFALHCPNLTQLALFVDASTEPVLPSTSSFIPFKKLETLSMGVSVISDNSADDIALWLSNIVPPGCKIDYSVHYNDYTLDDDDQDPMDRILSRRSDEWSEVTELLPVLIRSRMEEREKMRDMEKELKNLRDTERELKDLRMQMSLWLKGCRCSAGVNVDESSRAGF